MVNIDDRSLSKLNFASTVVFAAVSVGEAIYMHCLVRLLAQVHTLRSI